MTGGHNGSLNGNSGLPNTNLPQGLARSQMFTSRMFQLIAHSKGMSRGFVDLYQIIPKVFLKIQIHY